MSMGQNATPATVCSMVGQEQRQRAVERRARLERQYFGLPQRRRLAPGQWACGIQSWGCTCEVCGGSITGVRVTPEQ
jgi:hypothetical protein